MGTDITGWVEVKRNTRWGPAWQALVYIGELIGRNYDMFGCLFGISNYAHFRPVAMNRGIPRDLSSPVWRSLLDEFDDPDEVHEHSCRATWILWSEIAAIDWEEEGEYPDSRVHRYIHDEHGNLVFDDKAAAYGRPVDDLIRASGTTISDHSPIYERSYTVWPEGMTWEWDDAVYKSEKVRRKEARNDDWDVLFDTMRFLATRFGNDEVRLVAWFV